ncbi:MAG: hypothetical protein V4792_16415 [Pseudomonadota bacterium]
MQPVTPSPAPTVHRLPVRPAPVFTLPRSAPPPQRSLPLAPEPLSDDDHDAQLEADLLARPAGQRVLALAYSTGHLHGKRQAKKLIDHELWWEGVLYGTALGCLLTLAGSHLFGLP